MIRLVAALAVLAAPAFADTVLGDLRIERPMLRDTPPNAPVAGGFVTIENSGAEDDTLVSAAIDPDLAEQVQLHRMDMENGVMRMSEVAGGIPVPAGETVVLEPGGLHIMLMGLKAPLTKGESVAVTLTFASAGRVAVDFPVLDLGQMRAAAAEADGAPPAQAGAGN